MKTKLFFVILMLVAMFLNPAPVMAGETCPGEFKLEGPGVLDNDKVTISIAGNSRSASWSAKPGYMIARACVKGGSEGHSANGYLNDGLTGEGTWTVPDGLADISHVAVDVVIVPTETLVPTEILPTVVVTETLPVTPTKIGPLDPPERRSQSLESNEILPTTGGNSVNPACTGGFGLIGLIGLFALAIRRFM